jgi:hypothetical protein
MPAMMENLIVEPERHTARREIRLAEPVMEEEDQASPWANS